MEFICTQKIVISLSQVSYFSNFFTCTFTEIGRDFVRRLLETDPVMRISASDALEHPWISVGNLLTCALTFLKGQGCPLAAKFNEWVSSKVEAYIPDIELARK